MSAALAVLMYLFVAQGARLGAVRKVRRLEKALVSISAVAVFGCLVLLGVLGRSGGAA